LGAGGQHANHYTTEAAMAWSRNILVSQEKNLANLLGYEEAYIRTLSRKRTKR
jgi:hypothetical protein